MSNRIFKLFSYILILNVQVYFKINPRPTHENETRFRVVTKMLDRGKITPLPLPLAS